MRQSFKLKGSLFTLSVLQLLSLDLDQFATDLKAKVKMAPKFFNFTPMVIDLQGIGVDEHFDLARLKAILSEHEVIPVGIRGLPESMMEAAKAARLAIMLETNKGGESETKEKSVGTELTAGTKIIDAPVRSGQRIYAQNGDLIIVGSVSSSAELLADGNIHVYGVLRGRALAGVNGNTKARIFCQQLAAEIVSIAGHQQIFENIEQLTQRPTQVYLNDKNELIVARL